MNEIAQGSEGSAPDYSSVDSREKVLRLLETGELVALLMMPEAFGGDHRPENVIYVPPFVAQLKESIDDTVRRLIEEEKVREYNVKPFYSGKSSVPVGVTITATTPAMFAKHIAIWKPASTEA